MEIRVICHKAEDNRLKLTLLPGLVKKKRDMRLSLNLYCTSYSKYYRKCEPSRMKNWVHYGDKISGDPKTHYYFANLSHVNSGARIMSLWTTVF